MNTRRILISALCSLAFGLAACGGDNAAAAEEPVNNPFGGADQPVPTSQAVGASSAVILSSASGGGGGGQTGPVAGLAPSANTQFSTAMYKKWLDGHYVTLDKEATYYGEIADQFRHVFKEQYLPAARIVWSTTQGGGYATQCKVDESTESKMKYRCGRHRLRYSYYGYPGRCRCVQYLVELFPCFQGVQQPGPDSLDYVQLHL